MAEPAGPGPVISDDMLSRAWDAFCAADQRDADYGAALKAALTAALAGHAVLQLPTPNQTRDRSALWTVDALWIEAAVLAGKPYVVIDGTERCTDVVRRRALAMVAAADHADGLASQGGDAG